MSSGSGPYSRQPRHGKGKASKGAKGWVVSDECMTSITTAPTSTWTETSTFTVNPVPPPLDSSLRPSFVLEVRDWLRSNFSVVELDELFS